MTAKLCVFGFSRSIKTSLPTDLDDVASASAITHYEGRCRTMSALHFFWMIYCLLTGYMEYPRSSSRTT